MESKPRTGEPNKGIAKAKKEKKQQEANVRKQRYEKLDFEKKLGLCSAGSKQYLKLIQKKEHQSG